MTTVSLYVTDGLLPCSAVRKVSCSSVIGARLSAARISVSSGILRAKQLEHWSTRVAAFSARLLYPCCQVHRGSHWRQNSNDQRGRQGEKKKKKNILRLVNSGWHLNCGDRIHAKPLISKLHTTLSERENVVVVVVWRRKPTLGWWCDRVSTSPLCEDSPPPTCQQVFAQLMPSNR